MRKVNNMLLSDRKDRKRIITFLYRLCIVLCAIVLVILPLVSAVTITALVISGELEPLMLLIWIAPFVCFLIYMIILFVLTVRFGYYLDNCEIAEKYVGNNTYVPAPIIKKHDKSEKEEAKAEEQPKKWVLLRSYKIPSANASVPVNASVELVSVQDGKAKIAYVLDGKKYTFIVPEKDLKQA